MTNLINFQSPRADLLIAPFKSWQLHLSPHGRAARVSAPPLTFMAGQIFLLTQPRRPFPTFALGNAPHLDPGNLPLTLN